MTRFGPCPRSSLSCEAPSLPQPRLEPAPAASPDRTTPRGDSAVWTPNRGVPARPLAARRRESRGRRGRHRGSTLAASGGEPSCPLLFASFRFHAAAWQRYFFLASSALPLDFIARKRLRLCGGRRRLGDSATGSALLAGHPTSSAGNTTTSGTPGSKKTAASGSSERSTATGDGLPDRRQPRRKSQGHLERELLKLAGGPKASRHSYREHSNRLGEQ